MPEDQLLTVPNPFQTYAPPTYLQLQHVSTDQRMLVCSKCGALVVAETVAQHTDHHQTLVDVLLDLDERAPARTSSPPVSQATTIRHRG